MVSVTPTATDIPGADLSKLLVLLFWHRYREKCLEQARDCDLSCLPSIQNTLNHLGLVPGSLGNRWKKALGSWLGKLPQHITGMSSILRCSRSYFNRFSLFAHRLYHQVSCPSPQSHELCNRYGFSDTQVSNRPPANFAIHCNTQRGYERATGCDVTSIKFLHSCVQLAYCIGILKSEMLMLGVSEVHVSFSLF